MSSEVGSGTIRWGSSAWRDSATAWMDQQLARAGIERTGEVEQPHLRPWGTALSAPTTRGRVWLKATAPGTTTEVRLYGLLPEVVPQRVLHPIAVDRRRSWILLPDGGPVLGELGDRVDLAESMGIVLRRYGELQRDLVPHVHRVLALGIADMRPARMVERLEEALAAVLPYVEQSGSFDDRRTYEQLTTAAGTVATWCDELESLPGPASLDHNDLHPWNVFVAGPDAVEQPRFYDWGDAVVAHPFASLMFPLWIVRDRLGGDTYDPRLLRVRDSYLHVFDDLGPHDVLVRAQELACRIGMIARALTWSRALAFMTGDEVEKYEREPFTALVSLLHDSYLGTT